MDVEIDDNIKGNDDIGINQVEKDNGGKKRGRKSKSEIMRRFMKKDKPKRINKTNRRLQSIDMQMANIGVSDDIEMNQAQTGRDGVDIGSKHKRIMKTRLGEYTMPETLGNPLPIPTPGRGRGRPPGPKNGMAIPTPERGRGRPPGKPPKLPKIEKKDYMNLTHPKLPRWEEIPWLVIKYDV